MAAVRNSQAEVNRFSARRSDLQGLAQLLLHGSAILVSGVLLWLARTNYAYEG